MFQAARDYLPLPVIDEIYKVLVKKSKSTPGAISEKPLLFLNFHLNVAPSSQYRATVSTTIVPATASSSGKTVGRWLKDRREKKQEEIRAQNAQLHSAVSAAGVAPAVAVIAAAFASTSIKGQEMAQSHMALASPATLVAALCVEVAESMGAERNHLTFVVISAINVRSADNIMTLTAACHRCGILLLVLSSMYTFEGHEAAIYFVFPHHKENIQIRKWTFA